MAIIYKAVNKINNKIYIGVTIKALQERRKRHEVNAKNNYINTYFYYALNKYGIENWKWVVLEKVNNKERYEKEKYYIKKYKSYKKEYGYNSTLGGEGANPNKEICKKISQSLKGHPVSDETKEKIRQWHLGITYSEEINKKKGRKGENHIFYKRKFPEDTKIKIRETIKRNGGRKKEKNSFYGKCHTNETKEKIRKCHLGREVSLKTRKKISTTSKFKNKKEILLKYDVNYLIDLYFLNKGIIDSCKKYNEKYNTKITRDKYNTIKNHFFPDFPKGHSTNKKINIHKEEFIKNNCKEDFYI